jgi:hypothetical protein
MSFFLQIRSSKIWKPGTETLFRSYRCPRLWCASLYWFHAMLERCVGYPTGATFRSFFGKSANVFWSLAGDMHWHPCPSLWLFTSQFFPISISFDSTWPDAPNSHYSHIHHNSTRIIKGVIYYREFNYEPTSNSRSVWLSLTDHVARVVLSVIMLFLYSYGTCNSCSECTWFESLPGYCHPVWWTLAALFVCFFLSFFH